MQIFHKSTNTIIKKLLLLLILALAMSVIYVQDSHALENVSECVNPKHYDVERASDIKDKQHNGEKREDCYSKAERDEAVKDQYNKWLESVKKANETYTQKYNAYASALKQRVSASQEIEAQNALIEEKQQKLNKAVAYAYKQNYSGSLIAKLLLSENFEETLVLKKYLDSTLNYMVQVSEELKAEKAKLEEKLNQINDNIANAKEQLIEAASKINDGIPETTQELRDYIDANSTQDFKSGRELVNKDLSDDWVIDVALFYVGTPYVWGGKDEKGADCSGFTSLVYSKALNIDIGKNTSNQYEKLEHVDKNDLTRCDVLFMENKSDASQEHVGIFLNDDTYIHSSGTGTLSRVDTGIDYFTCGLRVNENQE